MNIAVIGASGSIGSEIARQIVSTRLLENNERLQLVGRTEGVIRAFYRSTGRICR